MMAVTDERFEALVEAVDCLARVVEEAAPDPRPFAPIQAFLDSAVSSRPRRLSPYQKWHTEVSYGCAVPSTVDAYNHGIELSIAKLKGLLAPNNHSLVIYALEALKEKTDV